MSLLRDIQNAAIDDSVEITVVLRKCKVLAARLGNEEFKNWVESELNGYKEGDQLPEYRIIEVFSKGHFMGPFGAELKNADIPLSCLPENIRDNFRFARAREPISAYSAIIVESKGQEEGTALAQWPPELVAAVGRNIYQNANCLSAWQVIPINAIVSLIDIVRNRVLSFVLEIEAENPNAGEAEINSNPVPQDKVTKVFNTYITGDVENIATGSTDVTQIGFLRVINNDIDSLLSHLKSFEIKDDDLKALKESIESDHDEKESKTIWGPQVTTWLSKMLNKSSSGAWKISTSVATSVLTKAINTYYGLG